MADDQNSVSSSTSRLPPSSTEEEERTRVGASELEASFETSSASASGAAFDNSAREKAANINGEAASGYLRQSSGGGGDLTSPPPSFSSPMLDREDQRQQEQQVAAASDIRATAAAAARGTTSRTTVLTNPATTTRPLILITDSNSPTNSQGSPSCLQGATATNSSSGQFNANNSTIRRHKEYYEDISSADGEDPVLNRGTGQHDTSGQFGRDDYHGPHQDPADEQKESEDEEEEQEDEEQVEEIDGIRYRIVAAVTTKQRKRPSGGKKSRPKQLDESGVMSKAAGTMRAYQSGELQAGSGAAAASTKPLNSNNNNSDNLPYRTNQGRPKVVIMGASGKVDKENSDNDYCSPEQHGVNFNLSATKDHGKQRSAVYSTDQLNDYDKFQASKRTGGYLHEEQKRVGQEDDEEEDDDNEESKQQKLIKQQNSARRLSTKSSSGRLSFVRRKSSAFVSNLLQLTNSSSNNNELGPNMNQSNQRLRRLSIYEMTKSPPPETSLEIYLSERRRSSTVSSKQVQQQLAEQQSTFETNYCQRQQYFKDLNQKLINQDKKLLNVVANRGQIHRHSVDIAQLPLVSAAAKGSKSRNSATVVKPQQEVVLESNQEIEVGNKEEQSPLQFEADQNKQVDLELQPTSNTTTSSSLNHRDKSNQHSRLAINQSSSSSSSVAAASALLLLKQTTDKYLTEQVAEDTPFDGQRDGQQLQVYKSKQQLSKQHLAAIKEDGRRYLMGK